MPASDLNASITKVQNEFALRLLREVLCHDHNSTVSTVLSPPSVTVSLALAYTGAKDKTAEQMGQLLAKGSPKYRILPHFGALLGVLQGGGKKFAKFTIEAVNKILIKADLAILDAYKDSVNRYFGPQIELVDFGENMKQVLATTTKVNKIVQDATHGAIQEFIRPEAFNSQTQMLLLSAFYFKGKWAEKFDPDLTQKKSFNISEGAQKEVPMMHKTHFFDYYENPMIQALSMPCGEFNMYFVLPTERVGLQNYLSNLTMESLLDIVQNCKKVKVNVALPKFKLECLVELSQSMKQLGLVNCFENANFQGILANESLSINKVLHKILLEVDEQGGTDEASAHAGLISPTSPPPKFVADHPFAIFLISQPQQIIFLAGVFRG